MWPFKVVEVKPHRGICDDELHRINRAAIGIDFRRVLQWHLPERNPIRERQGGRLRALCAKVITTGIRRIPRIRSKARASLEMTTKRPQ